MGKVENPAARRVRYESGMNPGDNFEPAFNRFFIFQLQLDSDIEFIPK